MTKRKLLQRRNSEAGGGGAHFRRVIAEGEMGELGFAKNIKPA